MFLILITPQIVNLKMIRDVLKLRKCYQCGGETLIPVVKHNSTLLERGILDDPTRGK
jgi:hypothetical protein